MRLHHVCMHESCARACTESASKWHFPRACTARPMHAGPAPAPGTSWRMCIWIICAIKHVHACMQMRASMPGPPQGCRAHASRGAQIFTPETRGGQKDHFGIVQEPRPIGGIWLVNLEPRGQGVRPARSSPRFPATGGFLATPKLGRSIFRHPRPHTAPQTTRPGPADGGTGVPWSLPVSPAGLGKTLLHPGPFVGMACERTYETSTMQGFVAIRMM